MVAEGDEADGDVVGVAGLLGGLAFVEVVGVLGIPGGEIDFAGSTRREVYGNGYRAAVHLDAF